MSILNARVARYLDLWKSVIKLSSLLFLISSCSRIADEDGCDAVDAAGDICCCRLLEKAGDGEKLPLLS